MRHEPAGRVAARSVRHPDVYDYVCGKSDWMAAGLPTERSGAHPPRVAEVMDRSVRTCEPTDVVADVMARLTAGVELCVVVNEQGVVQGRLRLGRLDPADSRLAEEAMEPGPATVRADADLAETTERMSRRGVASLIVSNPERGPAWRRPRQTDSGAAAMTEGVPTSRTGSLGHARP